MCVEVASEMEETKLRERQGRKNAKEVFVPYRFCFMDLPFNYEGFNSACVFAFNYSIANGPQAHIRWDVSSL